MACAGVLALVCIMKSWMHEVEHRRPMLDLAGEMLLRVLDPVLGVTCPPGSHPCGGAGTLWTHVLALCF